MEQVKEQINQCREQTHQYYDQQQLNRCSYYKFLSNTLKSIAISNPSGPMLGTKKDSGELTPADS